jgi:hypothetical protein
MTSALDDLITVIEFLMSSKTPTNRVAESLDRLKQRRGNPAPLPVDVRVADDYDGKKPGEDTT